jgi:hypothetical protein
MRAYAKERWLPILLRRSIWKLAVGGHATVAISHASSIDAVLRSHGITDEAGLEKVAPQKLGSWLGA